MSQPRLLLALSSGISLIELLLVIALISVIGATAAPFLSNFILYNNFEVSVQRITASLKKSQLYAMDNKQNVTWGVCMESSSVVRFFGTSCASPTQHEDFQLPSNVTISGLTTTTFNSRGEPSAPLTITISTPLESATLSVNSAGGITIN